MSEYKIVTYWSEPDEGYIGTSPDFEGVMVWGKTRQEASDEAEAAIETFIEIYKRDGLPLPKAAPVSDYSGQVRLRMSRFAHQRAAEYAEAQGISLNTFLSGAIEARLGISDYHQALLKEIAEQMVASTVTLIRNQFTIRAENVINLGAGEKPEISSLSSASNLALALK